MKYNLTKLVWDQNEYKALNLCIKKNSFTMGSKVRAFENKFASFFGSKYSIMVNSGSSANLLSIYSLFFKKKNPLKPGDEVIVPGLSWSTTFNPLINFGLKLKFVDISPYTLNIDENLLEQNITSKTKAIFAVNLLGLSCNYTKIKEIAKKYKLYLLEDNCESLGSKYKKKYNGTLGDLGTFSFFYSHHIQTMEGGMILTDNEELFQICLSLRAHGWTREITNEKFFNLNKDWFNSKFNFILPGFNVRPLEMSGALGLCQLKKISSFNKIRRNNALFFYDKFNNDPDFYLQKFDNDSSFFSFALIKRNESIINLASLLKYLRDRKIEVRPIAAGAYIDQPISKYIKFNKANKLKYSRYISKNSFYVGNYPKNLQKEITYLFNCINKFRNK